MLDHLYAKGRLKLLSDGLTLLQNQISVAPAQAGAQYKAALCLSHILLKIINLQLNQMLNCSCFDGAYLSDN